MQDPETQVPDAPENAQTCPQAPQFLASLDTSTQVRAHATLPEGQTVTQVPDAQTWWTAHAFSQVPQWSGVPRSTSQPSFARWLQSAVSDVQAPIMHTPPVQARAAFG